MGNTQVLDVMGPHFGRLAYPLGDNTGCIERRSYWIPGSYTPALSEESDSFFKPLKNKGISRESLTKVGLDALGTSTPLESNKSHD
jgi:hypothetical protein